MWLMVLLGLHRSGESNPLRHPSSSLRPTLSASDSAKPGHGSQGRASSGRGQTMFVAPVWASQTIEPRWKSVRRPPGTAYSLLVG